MLKEIEKTINDHVMIQKGERIIVAVSGGPDSIALLNILIRLRHRLGIQLLVAHFNHGLLKDSDRFQKFTEKAARENQCVIICKKVLDLKKAKGNLEEQARERRLGFLIQAAIKHKAAAVALGHHQDDLAETVLMRIIRGTGLQGLKGISPCAERDHIRLIRPLINISRSQIKDYLRKNKIKYCHDPSNRNTNLLRNRIRHKLLPHLEKEYQSQMRTILSYLGRTALEDYSFLRQSGEKIYHRIVKKEPAGQTVLSLDKWRQQPVSLQRMILRLAIEKIVGHTRRISFSHLLELDQLIIQRPVGSCVHLPFGIWVQKKPSAVIFSIRKP